MEATHHGKSFDEPDIRPDVAKEVPNSADTSTIIGGALAGDPDHSLGTHEKSGVEASPNKAVTWFGSAIIAV